MAFRGPGRERENLFREFIVDAGHGSIPMLLNSYNRIPEAIFITHPHFDHILGVDWIAQSYYRYHEKKKYPLYATARCWEMMVTTIPHLAQIIDFQELPYGEPVAVGGDPGTSVTAFPVYHGPHALGAAMLYFVMDTGMDHRIRILFTGDILTPLLHAKDYDTIMGVDFLVADSNNRFPYPRCNHWSLDSGKIHHGQDYLREWQDTITIHQLLESHLMPPLPDHPYFDNLKRQELEAVLCTSVFDFVTRIRPEKVLIVHYGGLEDERYYLERILTASELMRWIRNEAGKRMIGSEFIVPETASIYNL